MNLVWKVAFRFNGRRKTLTFSDIIEANKFADFVKTAARHEFIAQFWALKP